MGESSSGVQLNLNPAQDSTKSPDGRASWDREPPKTPELVRKGSASASDSIMEGLQYSLASLGGFLASPEVITLRASVNDKDIELIDLRRQLQKTFVEVKSAREEIKAKEKAQEIAQKRHDQSVLKLEREVHSKNEQIHKLSREMRQATEDASASQKKLRDASKEKAQRIELLKEEFKIQLEAAKRRQREKEESQEQALKLKRELSLVKHEKKLGEDLSKNEHERLKRRLQQLSDQVDQLTKETSKAKASCASKENEIKRLREELENKENQLKSLAGPSQLNPNPSPAILQQQQQNYSQAKLGLELYEREHRKKLEAMQDGLYRVQEKLDARVATSRKYKDAGRMLQRKVATLEAERYSKQSIIESLESRIDTLDKDMENTCQQLNEAKKETERIQSDFERELGKKEEALRDHLREKEEMEAILQRERQDLEMAKSESAKLAATKKDVEARLDQVASSYKAHREEVEPLESKVSNLVRRLASADEHIEQMGALLKEKDLDAERSRSLYQEQQAMIERQEHELNGMRIQYDSHMKRMQMQRQELDRFRTSQFISTASAGRARSAHHDSFSDTEVPGAYQRNQEDQAHDDQIAYLRSELNKSMQREKALILNIKDREKKLENAEKYLGNMDKVVSTLSKYT